MPGPCGAVAPTGQTAMRKRSDVGCRIDVEIDYELEGMLVTILGGIVDKVANKLVDAFSGRIEQAASSSIY